MRSTLYILLLFSFSITNAQIYSDFEDLNLPIDSFLNDSGVTGEFETGELSLENFYDSNYDFWGGWAISSMRDTVTPGYLNQYSSFAGKGAEDSDAYAVTYAYNPSNLRLSTNSQGDVIGGLYISNSTYAARSMLNGDSYAKKFGGPDGNDPDWLLLSIKKYYQGTLSDDHLVEFYLADFRDEDNSNDYIVKNWTWVDLTSLGAVDSLEFKLTSSDTGASGINTPAYFCIDHVFTTPLVSTANLNANIDIKLSPNPTSDFINVRSADFQELSYLIKNNLGQTLLTGNINETNTQIGLDNFSKGNYWIVFKDGNEIIEAQQFLKL